ncbi:TrmH family RNA methyltransferase [Candidatus Kaiserbacteria bacterium]|nr:TrmH family RNA methyltransferase [Candidatus Kaiserbacteria bacterium]
MKRDTFVILHNIRSAHNVGSVFRTADGAGVTKIYLTGYTPTPIDRFGRVVSEIAKTSLGATESMLWEYEEDISIVIKKLHEDGVEVIAVEQSETSIPYDTYKTKASRAYIFGNEVDGVPKEVCTEADAVVEIPMMGEKESLNVSVSAGVILYQDLRQKEPSSPA